MGNIIFGSIPLIHAPDGTWSSVSKFPSICSVERSATREKVGEQLLRRIHSSFSIALSSHANFSVDGVNRRKFRTA